MMTVLIWAMAVALAGFSVNFIVNVLRDENIRNDKYQVSRAANTIGFTALFIVGSATYFPVWIVTVTTFVGLVALSGASIWNEVIKK